jgi:hypothetical protein
MLHIQGKLISLDVIEEHFVCDLHACKGACCVEGDLGAPLENHEVDLLRTHLDKIKPYITQEGWATLGIQGAAVQDEDDSYSTPLIDNAACAYVNFDADGIVKCGIEAAYKDGAIPFNKPISCHLYPIRVEKNEVVNFEALNYDRWHICHAACSLGQTLKVPVYKFLKEPLLRQYGQAFYDELDAVAQDWNAQSKGQ